MGIIRFKVIIQAASTVGSVKEIVTIQARKDVKLKASDLAAKKDVTITGENVSITSKDNVYHRAETHEYKRTGFSVSLGGGALHVVDAVKTYVDRADQVRDNQLQALYGVQTYQTIAKNKDMLKDIKGKGMPSISVGFAPAPMRQTA